MRLPVRCGVVCGLQVLFFQSLITLGTAAESTRSGYSSGGYPYRSNTQQADRSTSTTGSRTTATPPRTLPAQAQPKSYMPPAQPRASVPPVRPTAPSASSAVPSVAPSPRSEAAAGTEAKSDHPAEGRSSGGSSPSVADALKLVPTQKEIDYALPTAGEASLCKISVQKVNGAVGWVVEDAQGATLRRFLDTNADGKVDQWCYYKDGLEVYRDIDSDFNGKVDQCRWYNTAGTRWAIDRDEDARIDSWRVISPEEVAHEVVSALAKQDSDRFARLVVSQEDIRSLGLGQAKTSELIDKSSGAAARFKAMAGQQKLVTAETKWAQFSGSHPGIIPAGTEGSTKDVEVYENVLAIVQAGASHGQLQIGTMVKAGEGWRVIDVPKPAPEGQNEPSPVGFFFRSPAGNRPQVAAGGPNEKAQAMLTELEKLDAAVNRAAGAEQQAQLNARRADLLEQLAVEASKPEDRAGWIRQMADMVSAAVQSGGYPEGAKRLESLVQQCQRNEQDRGLAGYVRFRQLTAEYGLAMQAKGDFAKVQSDWLKKLEQYVADYPKSPDAAEAMLQLAIAQEFAGQEEEAKKWYAQIVSNFSELAVAKKAAGARQRLDSVGKVIAVQGKSPAGELVELSKYRGKAVLIQYWATWCEPCKADMVIIKDQLEKYGDSNFAVIGVNLDTDPQSAAPFLAENKLPWPQICEEGGFDSHPAIELGILTLPTMILVDREGRVVNRNVNGSELAGELRKLIRPSGD